jgi:MoxR-like ATPase
MNLDELRSLADAIKTEIGKTVHGQDTAVDLMLVSLFARGHCLLEGPPGTAKTLLARSFASALSLEFGRIQFTPDLMPGDVLGTNLFDFQTSAFRLVKGPVFCDVLLGDEINRAPPKTQAALLQAMNERFVTIDGVDHSLGELFFVIATQNPIEHQGTYPLPEAQLDRFLFKIVFDFPDAEAELEILRRRATQPLDMNARSQDIAQVADEAAILSGRALVDSIRLDEKLLKYIIALVRATRADPQVEHGASTRAADALAGAVRAKAALDGRDFATPDDLKDLLVPALRHRLILGPTAEIEGRTSVDVLRALMDTVEVPR